MATFKVNGYENLQRKSANKVFTHAVIFRNDFMVARGDADCVGATFHISQKNAEADFRAINKRSFLTSLEIVEVEQVGA